MITNLKTNENHVQQQAVEALQDDPPAVLGDPEPVDNGTGPGDDSTPPDDSSKKKKNCYETLADRLRTSRVAIDIALSDTSLQVPFASYGYDITRITEGSDLLRSTDESFHEQLRAYERYKTAFYQFDQAYQTANDEYMRLLKIARFAFKDNTPVQVQLHLEGDRERRFGEWVHQTEHFYGNALSNQEIIDGMAAFGVTLETLQAGQQLVLEAITADTLREKMNAEAQGSTEKRDAKFRELRDWMSTFTGIAKLAFANDRQQLEKFGIVVP